MKAEHSDDWKASWKVVSRAARLAGLKEKYSDAQMEVLRVHQLAFE